MEYATVDADLQLNRFQLLVAVLPNALGIAAVAERSAPPYWYQGLTVQVAAIEVQPENAGFALDRIEVSAYTRLVVPVVQDQGQPVLEHDVASLPPAWGAIVGFREIHHDFVALVDAEGSAQR